MFGRKLNIHHPRARQHIFCTSQFSISSQIFFLEPNQDTKQHSLPIVIEVHEESHYHSQIRGAELKFLHQSNLLCQTPSIINLG